MELENEQLQLPAPAALPNSNLMCSHFVICDGGFPIKKYMMKPYMRNENITVPQRIFNFRHSHARRIIENAFRLLRRRWLVNEKALDWNLLTSEYIIQSCICLHNMIITMELDDQGNEFANRRYRVRDDCVHDENVDFNNLDPVLHHFPEMQGIFIRERLSQHFVSPAGSVPWQWHRI